MSDISPLVLATLHEQLRELEMDAVLIRGRTEQLRETIGYLEGGVRRRGGRPRKPAAGLTIINEPECDEQGPLPSIDDVKGILKFDPETAA
jgi:hypothetical protein